MDRLVYTALSAMQRHHEAQAVTANNLANAQVPGFRREMAAQQHGWLVAGGPAPLTTRVQAGAESPHDLLRAGAIETTGQPLDMALEGGAWLAVDDGTGREGLTRRGDLRIDPDGRLVTGDGRAVLGADGPLVVAAGFASARLTAEGSLEARATPEAPWVALGRLRLVTPDPATLERGPDGLFRTPEPLETDENARVRTGALERSNVDTARALIELVEQSRGLEVQTKLLQAAREMDERSSALMRVAG